MLSIETLSCPILRPARAAWARGRLLVVDAAGLCWLDGRLQVPLDGAPLAIALSPSGDHAAATLGHPGRVVAWRIDGEITARIPLGAAHLAAGVAFVRCGDEDVIAIASRNALALHRVDGGALATQPLGGLQASSVHRVAGGDAVAILGQEFAESRDTLAVFGTAEIPIAPATIGRRFRFLEGLVDTASLLAIGPAGPDRAVIFRDPRDTEEPLDDGDARAIVPREWTYRGYYVATRDGTTVQRIPTDTALASGTPLCASDRAIAAAIDGRIEITPRDGGAPRTLDLRWLGATPTGDRILAAAQDGSLQLIHLAG